MTMTEFSRPCAHCTPSLPPTPAPLQGVAQAPACDSSAPRHRWAALEDLDDFARNPYPYYEKWRAQGPVLWSPHFFQGGWLVTRHAEVEAVLKDPRFSTERTAGWIRNIEGQSPRTRVQMDMLQNLLASALLFMDGPSHAQLRKVLMAAFMPAQLKRRLPAIAQLVQTQMAQIAQQHGQAPFDYVAAFARSLPSRMTCSLMGIAQEDSPMFMDLSETLVAFISAPQPSAAQAQAASASLRTLQRYFQPLLARKRQQRAPGQMRAMNRDNGPEDPLAPQADLIDHLLEAEAQGLLRTDVDMLAQCAMLLVAGHDTTRNLLGNGLHALLCHPQQWHHLCHHPELAPQAVRELLRLDSPVQYTARRATVAMEVGGQPISRGQLVVALIGSANRDPRRHTQADALDITRSSASHLAFGRGTHFCIGAGLAQMLAEEAFTQLAQHWPQLHLVAPPQWNGNAALRGLQSLMVRTQAA